MSRLPPRRPQMEGLRRQIARARSAPATSDRRKETGVFVRQTYRLSRREARAMAREWFSSWPKEAYWTAVESWRSLPGGEIEFTMRRLPTAD